MVTYGDTDGSGMDGGQWSPAQCPPPTGHPPLCSTMQMKTTIKWTEYLKKNLNVVKTLQTLPMDLN